MSNRAVLVLALAMVVAGCTSTQDRAGVSMTVSTAATSTAVPTTTTETVTTPTVVGDPSLAGVQGVVRITEGLDDLKEEWGLLDPEGNYIGPIDVDGDPLLFEPIEGYADFSAMAAQERFDMDLAVRIELVYQCLSDVDPRFAQFIADTGGFNWGNLPGQLSQAGMATYIACEAGLHLPRLRQQDWTRAMWQKSYDYAMAAEDCIEQEAGIDLGRRLTLDEYVAGAELLPPDNAYASLDTASLKRLNQVCPFRPVGGYGAWEPGSPIAPAPAP